MGFPSVQVFALSILAIGLPASFENVRAAEFVETDVCVYGGTSGGITAAVQATRMGKTVALVVFNNHLGGMTSGGLGATDTGNPNSIQGLSREFYVRIARKYSPGSTSPRFNFEPKVAEAVFNEMVQEAGVPVYFDQRLSGVEMQGGRIAAIEMENGNIFRAKMFIDCTYEGDLMAMAGVSYTVGRERNSLYGETLNGVQVGKATGHQIVNGVDPYVEKGNPASGLLPNVNSGPLYIDGSEDSRVQAYCYRLCLTSAASNRVSIAQPEGYDEADYELLLRSIEANRAANPSYTGAFWSLSGMPNGKTDSNNNTGVSFDFIGGGSDEWAEAGYARREEIARAHERWQRGLIWTVQNHPRVPQDIRDKWGAWGLSADEFLDTGHWPHQLYVREARRMVSDYVMQQQNCQGARVASDSVGLASYTMDSHNVQRHVRDVTVGGEVVKMVKNEGDVQVGVPAPYPISYRSIVPRVGECENLFVTFALSASHIGFGSCRMEPVLMITSQSAATAACFAIDDAVAVQAVDYGKLKSQLLLDGQMLAWGAVAAQGIVVDNADAGGVTITGDWTPSGATSGYYGANYLHDDNAGKGSKSVRFRPTLPEDGIYEVFARWTAHDNRAGNVPIDIIHAGGTATATVDQRQQGGQWVSLGSYSFNAGTSGSVLIRNAGTTGHVIADAVQFVRGNPPVTISLWASNSSAHEPLSATGPARPARIALTRTDSAANPLIAPLTVHLTIGGSAINGTDYASVPSTVVIPAGSTSTTVSLVPLADTLAEGPETIAVGLDAGSGYVAGALDTVAITIHDRPFDAWRKGQFTASQLADPDQSDDTADADGDGLDTLTEFVLGRIPTVPDHGGAGAMDAMNSGDDNYMMVTFTRAKAADILVTPEVSSNLADWSSGSSAVLESLIADDGRTQTIVVRDLVPMESQPERFIRLRIRRAP